MGKIKPIQTGANWPLTLEKLNRVHEKTYSAFFQNALAMMPGPQMTATEIRLRQQEFLISLCLGSLDTVSRAEGAGTTGRAD